MSCGIFYSSLIDCKSLQLSSNILTNNLQQRSTKIFVMIAKLS